MIRVNHMMREVCASLVESALALGGTVCHTLGGCCHGVGVVLSQRNLSF